MAVFKSRSESRKVLWMGETILLMSYHLGEVKVSRKYLYKIYKVIQKCKQIVIFSDNYVLCIYQIVVKLF